MSGDRAIQRAETDATSLIHICSTALFRSVNACDNIDFTMAKWRLEVECDVLIEMRSAEDHPSEEVG